MTIVLFICMFVLTAVVFYMFYEFLRLVKVVLYLVDEIKKTRRETSFVREALYKMKELEEHTYKYDNDVNKLLDICNEINLPDIKAELTGIKFQMSTIDSQVARYFSICGLRTLEKNSINQPVIIIDGDEIAKNKAMNRSAHVEVI